MPLWLKEGPTPGSHVLHRLIQGKKEQIFLSEATRPKALIFGMKHHLMDFNLVCLNYAHGTKNWPCPGSHRLI